MTIVMCAAIKKKAPRLAAASVGALGAIGQAVAALRPLWTLVHVAALGLGVFLVWQGRQPAWMANVGSTRTPPAAAGWQALRGPTRRVAAGLAWAAWPCGLLQSALLVAALAGSPWQGAAVMATFAAASAAGLVLGPALWWRLGRGRDGAAAGTAAVRLAGLMLALASAWALGHGLWMRMAAWCGLA